QARNFECGFDQIAEAALASDLAWFCLAQIDSRLRVLAVDQVVNVDQAEMAGITATVIEGRSTPRRVDIRVAVRHQDRRVLRPDAVVQTTQMEAALSTNANPHFSEPLGVAQACRCACQEWVGMGIEDVKGVERSAELFRKRL